MVAAVKWPEKRHFQTADSVIINKTCLAFYLLPLSGLFIVTAVDYRYLSIFFLSIDRAYITEVSFERMVEASDFIPFSQVPVPIELRYRLQTLRNACTSRDNSCHQK